MSSTNDNNTEKSQPRRGQTIMVKYWILFIISLLVLLPITASHGAAAVEVGDPLQGNFLVAPSLSPTVKATASGNATATRTATVTPTRTATATATNTVTPSPTITAPASVKVTVRYASLRAGPGTNYEIMRALDFDEVVQVLGRLSEKTWLYVKTSAGESGWIPTTWVKVPWESVDLYAVQTPTPPTEATVKVSAAASLRTVPVMESSTIKPLEYGDLLTMLGWLKDHSWLYVKTEDGQLGWVKSNWVYLSGVNLNSDYYPIQTPPPTETSTPVVLTDVDAHWIDIDLSEQTLRAYDSTTLMGTFLVSTGIDEYPTVAGQFHVYAKFDYSVMAGRDYYLPDVPWSMYYSGDFSIHGTYWHHNFGHKMSHGCVNMDIADAKWLYDFSPVGTIVNIHY